MHGVRGSMPGRECYAIRSAAKTGRGAGAALASAFVATFGCRRSSRLHLLWNRPPRPSHEPLADEYPSRDLHEPSAPCERSEPSWDLSLMAAETSRRSERPLRKIAVGHWLHSASAKFPAHRLNRFAFQQLCRAGEHEFLFDLNVRLVELFQTLGARYKLLGVEFIQRTL